MCVTRCSEKMGYKFSYYVVMYVYFGHMNITLRNRVLDISVVLLVAFRFCVITFYDSCLRVSGRTSLISLQNNDLFVHLRQIHSLFTKYERIFNICVLYFNTTYQWFTPRRRLIFYRSTGTFLFFRRPASQFMHFTKLNLTFAFYTLVAEFTYFGKVMTVISETDSPAYISCALLENYDSYRFVIRFSLIIKCGSMVVV